MRQIRAIIGLPGTVLLIVPALAVILTDSFNPGWGLFGLLRSLLLIVAALVLLVGLGVLAHAIYLFIAIGKGTLAPWDPTRRLVVAGLYRRTRNPMYLGVLLVLLGEVGLAGSIWLAGWCLFVLIAFNLFVRFYEEPHLRKVYGDEYREFCANVPRWLPRRTPWEPPSGL